MAAMTKVKKATTFGQPTQIGIARSIKEVTLAGEQMNHERLRIKIVPLLPAPGGPLGVAIV